MIFIILAEYYFLSIFNLAYIDCILIIIISIYGASIIDLCYNMIDIKNILLKKIVGLSILSELVLVLFVFSFLITLTILAIYLLPFTKEDLNLFKDNTIFYLVVKWLVYIKEKSYETSVIALFSIFIIWFGNYTIKTLSIQIKDILSSISIIHIPFARQIYEGPVDVFQGK